MPVPKSEFCKRLDRSAKAIVAHARPAGLSDEHVRERVVERLERALAA